MFVSGLLLAAGASTRFGSVKMLAMVGGEPLLRRAARAFLDAGLDETVVVLGARADEVAAALDGLPVRRVLNAEWEGGMLSSVKAGLGLVDPRARRIAISPADIPGLTPALVRLTVEASFRTDEATATVPSHARRRGHPLVVPAALVPLMRSLPADARLSDLLQNGGVSVNHLEVDDPGVLLDVDRPEDLVRAPE